MVQLVASVVALFVGPALLWLFGRGTLALAFVDGLVMTALGGLIALHLLPESIEAAGAVALVAATCGLAAPPLIERWWSNRPVHDALLLGAIGGLAIHAALDGAAFAAASSTSLLPVAVVLHRIPEGLAAWWLLGVKSSPRRALVVLAVIATSTVVGFYGAGALVAKTPPAVVAAFQALVAGLLFHVVFAHAPRFEGEREPRSRKVAAGGALVAVLMLVLVDRSLHLHQDEHAHGGAFMHLALAAAPATLAAFAAAGLLHGLVPARSVAWLEKRGLGGALRGVVYGVPLPILACNVVPRYRALVRAGVPVAAALAFLLATPALGLDALVIGVPFIGAALSGARLGLAIVGAWIVAALVGAGLTAHAHHHHAAPAEEAPFAARLAHGLKYGFGELFDHVAPWVLFGMALAAAADRFVEPTWVAQLPAALQVPLMAVLGLPIYVCAAGAMPLVAVLLDKGLGAGAAVAFLLTAPVMHLTTLNALAALHGRRAAVLTAAAMVAVASAAGFLVDALMPRSTTVAHGEPTLFHSASLVAVAALTAVSLWRQGPRGFVAQLIAPHDREGHDHDAHHCGHHH
jgi:hypothetical protein